MAEALKTKFTCGLCKVTCEDSVPRRLPCQPVDTCEACILVHQHRLFFHCPLCDQLHSALSLYFCPEKLSRTTTAAKTTSAEAASKLTTSTTASTTTATTSTSTTTQSSSPNEDAECRIHGLGRSMFCKEDGCHGNICPMCLMKDRSNHGVIASENGFVYCRDPSILGKVEKQYEQMSVNARKMEAEVPTGNGNKKPEVEFKDGPASKTRPDEESSLIDIELVYDRGLELRKQSKCRIFKPMKQIHSSHTTQYTNIRYVSPVQSDDSFVVCGQRAGQWWLVRHRMSDGTNLDHVLLETTPTHAQEVVLNAHLTIAVSYRDEMVIDFHELTDLSRISCHHRLVPLQPGPLCVSSGSSLVCAITDEKSRELIVWFDCSSKVPTVYKKCRTFMSLKSDAICYMQHEGSALVKVGSSGLNALDTKKDEKLWITPMRLTSVTTDSRGRLFAVDENNHCVQMFSALNGRYMRYLIGDEFGIGHPLYVNWCYNTSTLILVHQKGEDIYTTFLNIFL